jgi:hypothetical protein
MSPTRAGLGLPIAGLLAIAAPPLSGALLGRFDARKVVLGCFAASALGFLAYIAVDSFASFLGVAIVIQFASRTERPATAVLALGVTPLDHCSAGPASAMATLAASADAASARQRSPRLTGLKANDSAMRAVNIPVAA